MALATRAILLSSTPFGEADRILTLFTLDHGKISARARGARKSWRRFGGALEPFALFEATLSQTNKRIWSLGEAKLIEAHEGLADDYARIRAASLTTELLREVVPDHESEPELFALIVELFGLLASCKVIELPLLTLASELKILEAAGIGVATGRCNACGRSVPAGRKVYFNPARGGVVCTPCGGGPIILSREAARGLIELSQTALNDLKTVTLPNEAIAELDRALEVFIVQHVGKTLTTRGL